MLWVSCGSSLLLFSTSWLGADTTAVFAAVKSADLAEIVKKIPEWWHAIAGLLTGAGTLFARRHHQLDKRLNRTWYWVSYAVRNQQTVRLDRGYFVIQQIHKFESMHPQDVIHGYTDRIFGGQPSQRAFRAHNILTGTKADREVYYEWRYDDGHESGISRLTYSLEKQFFFKKLVYRNVVKPQGTFFIENGAANGTIDYYTSEQEALAAYNQLAQNMP